MFYNKFWEKGSFDWCLFVTFKFEISIHKSIFLSCHVLLLTAVSGKLKVSLFHFKHIIIVLKLDLIILLQEPAYTHHLIINFTLVLDPLLMLVEYSFLWVLYNVFGLESHQMIDLFLFLDISLLIRGVIHNKFFFQHIETVVYIVNLGLVVKKLQWWHYWLVGSWVYYDVVILFRLHKAGFCLWNRLFV